MKQLFQSEVGVVINTCLKDSIKITEGAQETIFFLERMIGLQNLLCELCRQKLHTEQRKLLMNVLRE